MGKQALPIEDVIAEIEKLRNSPYVKLAKSTENHALRQKLYQLRSLEKKGRKIAELTGVKFEQEPSNDIEDGDQQ